MYNVDTDILLDYQSEKNVILSCLKQTLIINLRISLRLGMKLEY